MSKHMPLSHMGLTPKKPTAKIVKTCTDVAERIAYDGQVFETIPCERIWHDTGMHTGWSYGIGDWFRWPVRTVPIP